MKIKSRSKGTQMLANIGGGRGAQMLPPAPAQEQGANGVDGLGARDARPDAQVQAAARERVARSSTAPLERVPSRERERDAQKKLRDNDEAREMKRAADKAGLGGGTMDLEQLLALVQGMSQRAGAKGACSGGGGGGCNGGGGGGGCNNGGGGGGGGGTDTNNSNETFDASNNTNNTNTTDTTDATNGTDATANGDAAAVDFLKLKQANVDAAEQAVPKNDPLRKASDAALERQAPTPAVANELTRRAARAALEAGTARADVVKAMHKKIDGGANITRDERREIMIAGERASSLQDDADRRANLAKAARDAVAGTSKSIVSTRDAA